MILLMNYLIAMGGALREENIQGNLLRKIKKMKAKTQNEENPFPSWNTHGAYWRRRA